MNIVIAGAGASGLFCAGLLAGRHNVTVIDKGGKPGRKLSVTGGGRCNFTNLNLSADNFISTNPRFCKSAINRFNQYDFLELMAKHGISYEERAMGRLFCKKSSADIVDMLLSCCKGVNFIYNCGLDKVDRDLNLHTSGGKLKADAVVIATGGLCLPQLGVSPVAYKIAEDLGINVIPVRAGLVPLSLREAEKSILQELSGISLNAKITNKSGVSFEENLLFTHRGLSGPAVLQISNYWEAGDSINIDLAPHTDIESFLKEKSLVNPHMSLKNALSCHIPGRLAECLVKMGAIPDKALKSITVNERKQIASQIKTWRLFPAGTEGYRTAEVTLGGVDVRELSSKTMEARAVKGLYFIGEAVDVTGQLGGYNLQWCWSSAKACADALSP